MQKKNHLSENFSKEEIVEIQQLLKELKKIRQVEKTKDIENQITSIAEQQHFYLADFIVDRNYHKDRAKVVAIWQFLQEELK